MEEERPPAAGSGGFVVWLHGLGDCGRANEFIANHFSAAAFSDARWAFPTAPTAPVTCNRRCPRHHDASGFGGMRMPSWFDIHDTPITSKSVRGEEDVLRAVQIVHTMIDREIAAGTDPGDVFVFGLSQGADRAKLHGFIMLQCKFRCPEHSKRAARLLYPKALGGCAVFSGFLPFDSSSSSSFAARVTDEAKKTPVLWIHGGADSLIPVQEGRDGVKFLRGLGMSCEFKEYDRLGHTLAPYELEHCERWASEIALGEGKHEHGRQGPGEKKGVRQGTGTGSKSKSKLFCGVFNLFSK
ncbi:unnamed protein product [Miscanthus lutarioriparius]|uniref:Phospholipase/carboxylesterase/thioesterase domain-containing protein n=1 Tax=Miscanthus lutarioriparius TaxID=422564 RepID=A0A811QJC9_9POAL|nr:unnamed protein product [Miscanthus lutarioriparius]